MGDPADASRRPVVQSNFGGQEVRNRHLKGYGDSLQFCRIVVDAAFNFVNFSIGETASDGEILNAVANGFTSGPDASGDIAAEYGRGVPFANAGG
ncbi:hypothetical protein ABIA14_006255 [Sinorhizobium fredii]